GRSPPRPGIGPGPAAGPPGSAGECLAGRTAPPVAGRGRSPTRDPAGERKTAEAAEEGEDSRATLLGKGTGPARRTIAACAGRVKQRCRRRLRLCTRCKAASGSGGTGLAKTGTLRIIAAGCCLSRGNKGMVQVLCGRAGHY